MYIYVFIYENKDLQMHTKKTYMHTCIHTNTCIYTHTHIHTQSYKNTCNAMYFVHAIRVRERTKKQKTVGYKTRKIVRTV